MPRDFRVYLEDIREAITKIRRYTAGLSLEAFRADDRTIDAVVRNLEVIGEAAKKVPDNARKQHPDIEWKKIGGLRDILIHAYFGIDVEIVWDIVQTKLAPLERCVESMLES